MEGLVEVGQRAFLHRRLLPLLLVGQQHHAHLPRVHPTAGLVGDVLCRDGGHHQLLRVGAVLQREEQVPTFGDISSTGSHILQGGDLIRGRVLLLGNEETEVL